MQIATLNTVPEEISAVFPNALQVQATEYAVYVSYHINGKNCIVTYFDGDLTGNSDRISKDITLRNAEGNLIAVYSLNHYPGLLETEYEKTEQKHIWFGFLRY